MQNLPASVPSERGEKTPIPEKEREEKELGTKL